jgi:hypothetical protein
MEPVSQDARLTTDEDLEQLREQLRVLRISTSAEQNETHRLSKHILIGLVAASMISDQSVRAPSMLDNETDACPE